MESPIKHTATSRFYYLYELFIWLLYVVLYKYSYYLNTSTNLLPLTYQNFPYPQLIVYTICITAYVIPFYRWLAPLLLRKKQYLLFGIAILVYFGIASQVSGWLVSGLFAVVNPPTAYHAYYAMQLSHYSRALRHPGFWDLQLVVTDIVAFLSLTFMWLAFENERTRHLLERDNLLLQLESLKAQLQPHFLFNTLNSIYGMSLTGNKDTPEFILRLSNMMRYTLYDCRQHRVPLEKDIEFLLNYIEMEKKRYPEADINFTIEGTPGDELIAPLLLIPFVENSFKHGSHRIQKGYIHGSLALYDQHCVFQLRNDHMNISSKQTVYGGVGIVNVQQRLSLYYPGKHQLTINNDHNLDQVELKIFF